jgi:hypothetical protein
MSALEEADTTSKTDAASEVTDDVPLSTGDPVMLAAALSVAYSMYEYYVQEDKVHGLFTGLWAPTLLGAATYLQQKELRTKLKNGLSL